MACDTVERFLYRSESTSALKTLRGIDQSCQTLSNLQMILDDRYVDRAGVRNDSPRVQASLPES
jgi:hypothetical protein